MKERSRGTCPRTRKRPVQASWGHEHGAQVVEGRGGPHGSEPSACTTSTIKPTGVVKGLAPACVSTNVASWTSTPRLTVLLHSGETLVKSESFLWPDEGDSYRFSVPPGSYVLRLHQRGPLGSRVFQ